MRIRLMRCTALFLVILPAILALPPAVAQPPLKKASFLPQWIPQAQFAGYFVAKEKGFYRDAGIDLTLLTGGPGHAPFVGLAGGKVTFCTGWLSTAITKRAAGISLVNLAQIVQRSALLLVATKKSGINTLADLNGRTVGWWTGEFHVPLSVFLGRNNLRLKVIPNYTSITMFTKHAVDAMGAMWYNEYHSILNSGYDAEELTVFRLGDLGADFPEDGLYCLQETFEADPEMCAAFVQASLRGWLYAFDHGEEALNIVMKYAGEANTGTNRAHQGWMLAGMKDLILPEADRAAVGELSREDYMTVGKALKSLYLVDRLPDYREFYRGRK
ncbi:MAG: ABC transporter substrate-binding protein [Pseudomonadota bacterium]